MLEGQCRVCVRFDRVGMWLSTLEDDPIHLINIATPERSSLEDPAPADHHAGLETAVAYLDISSYCRYFHLRCPG